MNFFIILDRILKEHIIIIVDLPKWRNWQTRYVQGVVRVLS